MNEVNLNRVINIYEDIAILSAYVSLENSVAISNLVEIIFQAKYSENFLRNIVGRDDLENLWAQKSLLEGVPNISLVLSQLRPDIPSAIHLSSFVKLAAQLSRKRARYETPCLYHFIDVLGLAGEFLEECVENSRRQKGIIFIMDMTRSTDFIVRTRDEPHELSFNLSELKAILIDFGNKIRINFSDLDIRYWITEGDKFISFIPLDDSHFGRDIVWDILNLIYRNLREIKDNYHIGFKAGAHWGWLFLMGNFIYSNTDIIITTRAMEFSKRDDVIIITDELYEKISEENRRYIRPARILVEGKPSIWIRPTETSISINGRELKVYEIGDFNNVKSTCY